MSKRQKSLFAADFSAVAKSKKLLFASTSLQQKSTNFLPKFVSKSKICSRNSRISTFDCRYGSPYDFKSNKRAFSTAAKSSANRRKCASSLTICCAIYSLSATDQPTAQSSLGKTMRVYTHYLQRGILTHHRRGDIRQKTLLRSKEAESFRLSLFR